MKEKINEIEDNTAGLAHDVCGIKTIVDSNSNLLTEILGIVGQEHECNGCCGSNTIINVSCGGNTTTPTPDPPGNVTIPDGLCTSPDNKLIENEVFTLSQWIFQKRNYVEFFMGSAAINNADANYDG